MKKDENKDNHENMIKIVNTKISNYQDFNKYCKIIILKS